jgi:putative transposase
LEEQVCRGQTACVLQQVETGTPVANVIRRMGVPQQTFYRWQRVYGRLGFGELRRVKQRYEESRSLTQLAADLSLDKHLLEDVRAKKFGCLDVDATLSRVSRRPMTPVNGLAAWRSALIAHRLGNCRSSPIRDRCSRASTILCERWSVIGSTYCCAGKPGL